MKTAEQIIIEKVGEFWWVCGKHKPEFIEAMEEYATLKLSESKQQLPVVKDWDEVFNEYINFNRNNNTTFVHLLDWLKQHYLLPSEQTLKELSEISNEDIKHLQDVLGAFSVDWLVYEMPKNKVLKSYQYLQSKSYKLPKYF